jgi:hypothetical protein
MLWSVLFLFVWLLLEGLIIWLILKDVCKRPCPYGVPPRTKSRRKGSPEQPNFYQSKDDVP